MDILSDVSINGSLTVNKDLNVTGTSVHQGSLAVNSAVFASSGFGFNVGSVDITGGMYKVGGTSCVFMPAIQNVFVCGIFYGDSNFAKVIRPNDISKTRHIDLNVPSGCQKFMISEIKSSYLPVITMVDSNTKREVKMDLSVEIDCSDYYAVASRTSTDSKYYYVTVIE